MKIKINNLKFIISKNNIRHLDDLYKKYNNLRKKILQKNVVDLLIPEITPKYIKMKKEYIYELANHKNIDNKTLNSIISDLDNLCFVQLNETSIPLYEKENILIISYLYKNGKNYNYINFNDSYKAPQDFIESDPKYCDCSYDNSYRKKKFYIKHNNDFKSVCSDCLKDIIGYYNVEILNLFSNAKLICENFIEDNKGDDNILFALNKNEFINYISAVMRLNNYNFISLEKSLELDLKPSTYKCVHNILDNHTVLNLKSFFDTYYIDKSYKDDFSKYISFIKNIKINDDDKQLSLNARHWFRINNFNKYDSDYIKEMFYIMKNEELFIYQDQGIKIQEAVDYYLKRKKEKESIKLEQDKKNNYLYIADTKSIVKDFEVKLTHVFLKTDSNFNYSDRIDYIFESRDGRTLKWKASQAQILSCFKDCDNFEDLENLIKMENRNNNSIWCNIKFSVASHEVYKTRKGKTVYQTIINRVSSVSDEYKTNYSANSVIHLNGKYKLKELRLEKISDLKLNNIAIYIYTFKDAKNDEYKIVSYVNLEDLILDNYYKFPMQITNKSEIVGYFENKFKKINKFSTVFVDENITKLKAERFFS